uniref:N-acetyltransferase domain-containing protein n=1 Tax=Thermogemmatispora argillosa TaxID=2045280 RepID=A0A455SWN3_9CHLR|nr:hypothetical protein KTA_02890 [Thermogemmatispora argillosa]
MTIRPIRPEDEPLVVRFHKRLSERTVYLRWLHVLGLSQRIAHERLVDRCFIDYDRVLALMAISREEAEFALLIGDQVQGQGLGTKLLRRLMEIARQEGLQRLQGRMVPEKQAMLRICRTLGFQLAYHPEEQLMQVNLPVVGRERADQGTPVREGWERQGATSTLASLCLGEPACRSERTCSYGW